MASGLNRVNEKTIKQYLGEKLEKADGDFALVNTGFAIGGIPPIRYKNAIATYIDEDLMQYEEIWAAAGTPNDVFRVTAKFNRDNKWSYCLHIINTVFLLLMFFLIRCFYNPMN